MLHSCVMRYAPTKRAAPAVPVFVLFLALAAAAALPAPAGAQTLKELFTAATAASQDYSMFAIDLEIANLKKTKGEIEAKVELDRVNAQSAYVTATGAWRASVLGFYNEVIDAVFAAAVAEIDVQSAGLLLDNAREDRKYADSRLKNGLLSEEGFKEIDIALQAALNAKELADWTLKDARDNLRLVAGLEWKPELLPAAPEFEPAATADEWIAKDLGLEKARLAEKIAALRAASLAMNASVYDRKILDTESTKAKVAAANAQGDARRAFESANSNLRNQAALLRIRGDEQALKDAAARDALRQYESGIISLAEKNQKAVSALSARKNLLAARKSYIRSIGAYLSALGEKPLGL